MSSDEENWSSVRKKRHSWTINISIYIIFAKGLTHDFGKKNENVIKMGLKIMF